MVDWNTETTEMDSLEFVSLREQMKETDGASFSFDRVRMSSDAGSSGEGEVITLVNTAASQAAGSQATGSLAEGSEATDSEAPDS